MLTVTIDREMPMSQQEQDTNKWSPSIRTLNMKHSVGVRLKSNWKNCIPHLNCQWPLPFSTDQQVLLDCGLSRQSIFILSKGDVAVSRATRGNDVVHASRHHRGSSSHHLHWVREHPPRNSYTPIHWCSANTVPVFTSEAETVKFATSGLLRTHCLLSTSSK